ncbi:MAG: hypothetical protein SF066_09200 [Thermoanaerobaculia bacterium]|nr:hypothetical protein [Thermoanaerobaculia bacterium]
MTTLTLEQRREIDLVKEQLVQRAEKLLDDVGLGTMERNLFGHSQLRNLSAIAVETQSPAVVTNFIRFQIGRAKKDQGWAKPVAGKRLGQHFIEALEGEEELIPRLALEISRQPKEAAGTQVVRIELIRHFVGFASRYLRFLDLDRPGRNGEEHS